jgi:molybdate transport system substrate-binding protein
MSLRLTAAVALLLAGTAAVAQPRPPALVVSVAASLADVMSELAHRHERTTSQEVRLNVGGSNTLARQIAEGAGADAFVSADDAQMDVVERAGRLVAGSRVPLLTNRLVVVGRRDGGLRFDDARALGGPNVRRVALGNPDSVPAGVYARRWLEGLGLWAAVAPKVVPSATVRSALAAAKAGRVDAAVVYVTDAASEPSLPVLYRVPPADVPSIVYPVAVIDGPRRDAAARFVAFLRSADAGAVFEAAGFGLAPR